MPKIVDIYVEIRRYYGAWAVAVVDGKEIDNRLGDDGNSALGKLVFVLHSDYGSDFVINAIYWGRKFVEEEDD